MSFLRSGSDEDYRLKEEADYIHRKYADATTYDERDKWAEKGEALAREMRAEYGLGDKQVQMIINDNYLDRLR